LDETDETDDIMNAATRAVFVAAVMSVLTRWDVSTGAEPDEVDVFVRSVLAAADRAAPGLPDADGRPPAARRDAAAADGDLPAELRRYLEGLVSVSSVADGQTLAAMLWDDRTVVDDEDEEPHRVSARYHDRDRGNGSRADVTVFQ